MAVRKVNKKEEETKVEVTTAVAEEEEVVEATTEATEEEVPTVEVTEQTEEPEVKVEVDTEVAKEEVHVKKDVRIRVARDHRCFIGGEMYDLKAGSCYNVPEFVKKTLNRAGILAPL
jgi:hypothetical protein